MARLDLEFVGLKNIEGNIIVNGKFVKLKKNKNKIYACSLETKENMSEIIIYKTHQYFGKHWFLWNFMFFFISIFGIFDIKHEKKCLVLDGRFNISTQQDTKVILRRKDFEDGGKFIDIETNAEVNEISNIQYYDKEAKKRHSNMKKIKIATFCGVAILAVLLIVLL